MIQASGAAVTVRELPQRVLRSLEGTPLSGAGLFVRYLRCKPGRGLTIVYHASAPNAMAAGCWITASLDEAVPDVLVQPFPADRGLPALAECCRPVPDTTLFAALEASARIQLAGPAWRLISVTAEPVRYKPSSRCVIRYRLFLEDGAMQRDLTLFGKLYADAAHARTIHSQMHQLYWEQLRAGQPFLPRPLCAADALGLTLNEAIQPSEAAEPGSLRPGLRAFQPRLLRDCGGRIQHVIVPTEELRWTAAALARLHTSAVRPASVPRTGAKEAGRVRERAALIAAHSPAQALTVRRVAGQLATRLEALRPEAYRPAHGGFKPSQLLFHSQRVFVVDLDGLCLADPALDAGYFLAYLRPSGLWYHRPGMRRWFENSAAVFIAAYRQALCERGVQERVANAIVERRRLYEAALLFKIATRRVNRLNSPRPGELSAMLTEIVRLMD